VSDVTLVAVDDLQAHPANPRRGNVDAIRESIRVNGWHGVIVAQASTGRIVVGTHRWLAAKADSYLDQLLKDIKPKPEPLSDPDNVPEPTVAVTQLGDLWELGDHRLLCGDATHADDYELVLNGERAALGLTDPPYGVGIDYDGEISDDAETIGELVEAFMPLIRANSDRVLITSGRTVLWRYPPADWILGWTEPAGVGRGPWGFICSQPVLAYGTCPYLAAGLGARPDTFIGKGQGPSSDAHPVAKPIDAWRWFMERGSIHTDDLVLDPFAGSGTTVIAAQILGRRAAMLELSPRYCDVICARFQAYTGIKPVRNGEPVDFAG
jgi:site-specific DNA-methyltransferase (adenine-specific)